MRFNACDHLCTTLSDGFLRAWLGDQVNIIDLRRRFHPIDHGLFGATVDAVDDGGESSLSHELCSFILLCCLTASCVRPGWSRDSQRVGLGVGKAGGIEVKD